MSLISNVTAYSYTDKISALTVATTPYNNTGQYYNVLYIGTSNGKIYSLTDSSTSVYPVFQIVPSTGVLNGEITGIAVDPTGKYLFINAPYDNHCLRISIIDIPLATAINQTQTVRVDRDIYTYGDNTGGITVDSQGVVYLVTGRGSSISTMERYGNSFVNLLFKNEGASLNFRGIALSPNEQVIYSVDTRFGSIYYYNFLNYQPTFDSLTSAGVNSSMRNISTLGNNIYYTQTDGIYVKNTYVGSVSHIVGTNMSGFVYSEDPLNITLSGTNTVAVDSVGSVYLSSTAYNNPSSSVLYKTTFVINPRSNYQAPVPRQQQPVLQPYPTTSCKRIVEPFNPRLQFGWGLTNTKKPPILDLVKSPLCCPPPIVNCPVTPFYCLPTPVVPPNPPPVAPVYPVTVSTRQYIDHAHTTGFRSSISVPVAALLSTSLTFTAGTSFTQPALGPLGQVYSLANSGTLTKILLSGQVVSSVTFGSVTTAAGPVVSTKGAVTIATDNGKLYRLNSDMVTLPGYPMNLGGQVFGSPANITNGAFDYIVAAYGNTVSAINTDNVSKVWSAKTQTPGETFRTSVATDGISVFVGSDNRKVYSYLADTGTLNWTCSLAPSVGTIPYTPYATSAYVGVTFPNDSNIFIVSNTVVRVSAYDITVRLRAGLNISSPPVLSTDPAGNLWAHILTISGTTQKLFGIGGIFNAFGTGFSYKYIWSNASGEEIPSSYTLPVLDSSGYIYVPSTYGVVNQYYAYLATASASVEVTQPYVTQFVMNGTSTKNNPPIQVSQTPLITSQNAMYVIATDRSSYPVPNQDNTYLNNLVPVRQYLYTISG